jgi:hypothetical protein
LTGYYFEDVTDVEDEDVELMITELLEWAYAKDRNVLYLW